MVENEVKVKEWLTEIFQNNNFHYFEFKFPNYDKKGGYASEIEFVDVIAEKNGIKQIIKLLIKKNKESETLLNTLNFRDVYANEIRLYSKILPHFAKFAEENNTTAFDAIPRCYGTVLEQDHYVIILENLKPEGYKIHELNEYMDLNHVKLILAAYGRWHAFNLAFRAHNPEVFNGFATTQRESKLIELYKNTIKHEIEETIELFKSENRIQVIENLEKLKANYDEIIRDAINNKNEDYIVIKHGDTWNNNFLFHYDETQKNPDKVVVIDWQLSYFSSPLIDVTNLLFGCCSRKEIEHVDELLKFYYNTLSRQMSDFGCDSTRLFPWEACLKSFERYAPIAIATIPLHMRLRFKTESDSQYDFENSIQDGNFSAVHGDAVRDPEKFLEDIYASFEYVIERKWI